jgi:hypothetical protein
MFNSFILEGTVPGEMGGGGSRQDQLKVYGGYLAPYSCCLPRAGQYSCTEFSARCSANDSVRVLDMTGIPSDRLINLMTQSVTSPLAFIDSRSFTGKTPPRNFVIDWQVILKWMLEKIL